MDNIYKQYDTILSATINNILIASRKGGKIVLLNFDLNNKKHLYMLKASQIALMNPDKDREIYLDVNIFKYLWTKFKLRNKYNFKRYRKSQDTIDDLINIEQIQEFMAEQFEVSTDIFKEIYEVYYE